MAQKLTYEELENRIDQLEQKLKKSEERYQSVSGLTSDFS